MRTCFTRSSSLTASLAAAHIVTGRRLASSLGSYKHPRVLITGGLGQVGTDLWARLVQLYGKDNVVVTDVKKPGEAVQTQCNFRYLDVLDREGLTKIVVEHDIDTLVHNSAIMSVLGEAMPHKAMDINITGVRNVLEVAREQQLKVFVPSTMAVFNEDAGKDMTKDDTILNPTTVYGITKVFLEQIGSYYHRKFGVDFRCLRYPGIISAATLPGGGTTDYAIHMYHSALKGTPYVCPVLPDEQLPMLYVDDCTDGTVQFIEAPREKLTRCVYNISGYSFSPSQLLESIKKQKPLEVKYEKGVAQEIAHSWPNSMDDTNARKDWGWLPKYDLDKTTTAMLKLIPELHDIKK